LDARSLAQIVRQLLSEADDAFARAPTIPRWGLARQLDEPQVRDLLARPFDDPGLMLALAYARLIELSLQRLNRVPEKNLLAFLDTMGVSLLPPFPARVPLTFALTPGTPPTVVPRGTRAATQATSSSPGVVFETTDELTVVPAALADGLTMDPTWDRYTDSAGQLDGSSPLGFTPFVGTRALPHRLYLGDDALLHIAGQATVTVNTNWSCAQPLPAVQQFFERLAYRYRTAGVLETVTPTAVTVTPGHASVRLSLTGPTDVETVQGVGLQQGLQSRWLRAELSGPLPDEPVAPTLELSGLRVRTSATGLQPDQAFANTAPLDLSTDFLPFGQNPAVGDAFYLASTEALGKPGARVTVNVGTTPVPPPTLRWEYSTADDRQPGWRPFAVFRAADDAETETLFAELLEAFFDTKRQAVPFLVDGTAGFTTEGRIMGIATDMAPMGYQGIRASWIRVRIASGSYAVPPVVSEFILDAQESQRPPELGYADERQIDLGRPFEPFGPTPSRADLFAFGEARRPFPDQIIEDRQGFFVVIKVEPDHESGSSRPLDLRWEYLGPTGWTEPSGIRDDTLELRRPGSVTLTVADAVTGHVNGQASHWLRARINSGGYGRPVDFEPVDPDDPKQGFRIRPGTGDVRPPSLRSLTLDYVAERAAIAVTQNGFVYDRPAQPCAPFVSVRDLTPAQADRDPTFYLGLDTAFPGQPISLHAAATPRTFTRRVVRSGSAAHLPSSALAPLQWEYFNGTDWSELTVFDDTSGLTASGQLTFLTPPDIARLAKRDLTPRSWVRARSATNDPFDTAELQGVFLNATPAVEARSVEDETVGSSNGRGGQQLRLTRPPVLPGQQIFVREPEPPSDQERETIVEEEGPDAIQLRLDPVDGTPQVWVRWHNVDTWLRSDLRSRHYVVDRATGVLTFGNGTQGLIPPPGTSSIVATYRSGGGSAGNVAAGAVAKIQNPPPGVAAVVNPVAADGGAEAETIREVEERGPQSLRHRQRAVSASDLTSLAREAAGTRVARVRCLTNVNRELRFEPGWVTLVIVPGGTKARLTPSSELIGVVQAHLGAHAFAGLTAGSTRINVIGPGYLQVTVVADIVPLDIRESERVRQRAIGVLDAFFHPLTGGPRGTGWEFARDVYESEVSQVLEGVPGLSHVERLDLLANQAQQRLTIVPTSVGDRVVPENSAVMTVDRRKAALLAEPLAVGETVARLAVKGVREGDRLTRALDLSVADPVGATTVVIDGVERPAFDVTPLAADPVGVPRGSRLITFDGALQTRLAQAIPRSQGGVSQIVVEDRDFVARLQPNGYLTALHPFPLTITAVSLDASTGVHTLGVEPYETVVAFPTGSTMATLDNRMRMPLAESVPAEVTATVIRLAGFAESEEITVDDGRLGALEIRRIDQTTDVVYLDENALVCPGPHHITPRAG